MTLRTTGMLAALALAAGAAACGGGDDSSPASPPGTAASPGQGGRGPQTMEPGSPVPGKITQADATLRRVGDTALEAVPGGTVISLETEQNPARWEVRAATSDGTEQRLDVAADGSKVLSGPSAKNESAADKAKHRDRVRAAKLSYAEAVQRMRATVPNGRITEFNLDTYRGTTVWEGDVIDPAGTKHEVKLDAANGKVLAGNP